MLTNTDPSARATAQIDAQNLMAEDVMVIPLFSMLKQFSAMQESVIGYNLEPSQNVHYNSISVFGLSGDSNSTNGTQIIIAVILVVLFGATFWFLRSRKTIDINETRSVKTTRLNKEKTTQVKARFCRGCGTRDDYQGSYCSECGMTL